MAQAHCSLAVQGRQGLGVHCGGPHQQCPQATPIHASQEASLGHLRPVSWVQDPCQGRAESGRPRPSLLGAMPVVAGEAGPA